MQPKKIQSDNNVNADFGGLLRHQAWVGGKWVDAAKKATFEVFNPASGGNIGSVPDMGAGETLAAIAAAKNAFPGWRATTAKERGKILRKWFELIMANVEPLAQLLTAEQGKPLFEARGEITAGAAYVEWFAEEARRVYGDTIPTHKAGTRCLVTKEPVGVCGAITPWNFPNAMITRKVAPALAAGCTVVLKPAEDTPFSALALAALAEKAGFPPGILNIVTGAKKSAPVIGKTLTESKDVRKISFTGSTEVGKILMRQSADTVKRISLELGGNAPFIVFESADLDKAADGAVICKYRNAGQTCICANRIYVQDSVYDVFAEKLAARVKAMKIGPGNQEDTKIGPLINKDAMAKVKRHVDDALAKGGKLVCGGKPSSASQLFFEPTIISNMKPDMLIKSEETFGPVAGLFKFSTEAEAVQAANDTEYGLAAYFYTKDLGQTFRVSEALEYGIVGVNEAMVTGEAVPFGGMKESGIGRENSKYGIEEFIEVKYIFVGGL
jgi:succinate-semialdehyde dehydrogenase / glutarate-semialdehyde dehydrogenase